MPPLKNEDIYQQELAGKSNRSINESLAEDILVQLLINLHTGLNTRSEHIHHKTFLAISQVSGFQSFLGSTMYLLNNRLQIVGRF